MASLKRMQGAVAIEFALVLGIFLALVYAVVTYALVFVLIQGFTYASEDGLRAAIAVDCSGLTPGECLEEQIRPAVRAQVMDSLGWLPADVRNRALGADGSLVTVDCVGDTCEAVISYNYAADPLLPVLTLPAIGAVPRVPDNLIGRARLRL